MEQIKIDSSLHSIKVVYGIQAYCASSFAAFHTESLLVKFIGLESFITVEVLIDVNGGVGLGHLVKVNGLLGGVALACGADGFLKSLACDNLL